MDKAPFREHFLRHYCDAATRFEGMLDQLSAGGDRGVLKQALVLIHSVRGDALTVGAVEVGELAGAAERLLAKHHAATEEPITSPALVLLRSTARALSGQLEQMRRGEPVALDQGLLAELRALALR